MVTNTYPKETLDEIYTTECCPNKKEQFRTFLSVIGNRLPGLNKNILLLYRFFQRGFFVLGDNEATLTGAVDLLAELYTNEPLQTAFGKIQEN